MGRRGGFPTDDYSTQRHGQPAPSDIWERVSQFSFCIKGSVSFPIKGTEYFIKICHQDRISRPRLFLTSELFIELILKSLVFYYFWISFEEWATLCTYKSFKSRWEPFGTHKLLCLFLLYVAWWTYLSCPSLCAGLRSTFKGTLKWGGQFIAYQLLIGRCLTFLDTVLIKYSIFYRKQTQNYYP